MQTTPAANTSYLQETVGAVLARGVAAAAAAAPADPVEFLAEWLLRSVRAKRTAQQHAKDKKQQHAEEARRLAEDQAEQARREAALAARSAAVQGLASMIGEPAQLWQAAVQLVKAHTSVSGAYLAMLADEEQPDWSPPPDGDPGSDDEAGDGSSWNAGPAGRGGEDGEQQEQEQEEDAGDAGRDGDEEGPLGSVGSAGDVSGKLLRYVAASAGHEWVTACELRRSLRAATDHQESDDADQQPPPPRERPVPVTFRILDERMPLLEVPAVAAEPRVTFLRGPPRVGGYAAAAVPAAGSASTASGSGSGWPPHAILAADTLLPDASGRALTADEVCVLWDVARALGAALDAAEARRAADAARGGAAQSMAGLAAAIKQLREGAAAPADVPEVGDEPPAAADEGEGSGGQEPGEPSEAELEHSQAVAAATKVVAANAAAALELEQAVLAATVKAVRGVRGVALRALGLTSASPPATCKVLRAVLLLLGAEPAAVATWREVRGQADMALFERIAGFDATLPAARDPALWARVRAAYKAAPVSARALQRELPSCGLGALLLAWVKQAKAVARAAAAAAAAKVELAAKAKLATGAQAASIAAAAGGGDDEGEEQQEEQQEEEQEQEQEQQQQGEEEEAP